MSKRGRPRKNMLGNPADIKRRELEERRQVALRERARELEAFRLWHSGLGTAEIAEQLKHPDWPEWRVDDFIFEVIIEPKIRRRQLEQKG